MTPGQGVGVLYKFNYPRGRSSCAGAWSYSEHAIFLLYLSILGDESDKLSIKQ